MLYGIHVPKLSNNQILYKNIEVFSIIDSKVIGARLFDYDFNPTIIPTIDIVFKEKFAVYRDSVSKYIHKDKILGSQRTVWTFDTEHEAFSQKLILLNKIRDIQLSKFKAYEKELNEKIPNVVSDIVKNIKYTNPEYFL